MSVSGGYALPVKFHVLPEDPKSEVRTNRQIPNQIPAHNVEHFDY